MPLYEYRCRNCGHCFEELVPAARPEDETPVCPACGSWETERQMSAFCTPSAQAGSALGGAPSPGGSCGSGGFT